MNRNAAKPATASGKIRSVVLESEQLIHTRIEQERQVWVERRVVAFVDVFLDPVGECGGCEDEDHGTVMDVRVNV